MSDPYFDPDLPQTTIRIKKGVRPNGGRRLHYVSHHTYPNGRRVVWVRPRDPGPHSGTIEYHPHEVEDLDGPREDTGLAL